jgi:hypothetical protein
VAIANDRENVGKNELGKRDLRAVTGR